MSSLRVEIELPPEVLGFPGVSRESLARHAREWIVLELYRLGRNGARGQPMSVVSNAGPLISLARIARLDMLRALYGEILIPGAVRDEVMSEAGMPGARELIAA